LVVNGGGGGGEEMEEVADASLDSLTAAVLLCLGLEEVRERGGSWTEYCNMLANGRMWNNSLVR
jgi:hypothetical protein